MRTELILRSLGLSFNHNQANEEGWLTISAPTRDDKNPSFALNIIHGGWKDNATGEAGDIYELVRLVNPSMTFPEAKAFVDGDGNEPATAISKPRYYTTFSSPFWTSHNEDWLEAAQEKLDAHAGGILDSTLSYDLLDKETLSKYNCGITTLTVDSTIKESLVIPYPTGAQIYTRGPQGKTIRMRPGSTPKESFFGVDQLQGKNRLIICKSPREAMLVSQEMGEQFDAIGICSGESAHLSETQSELLKQWAHFYEVVYVAFDRDTLPAEETAFGFARKVCDTVGSHKREVRLINIEAIGGNKCKDLTDLIGQKGTSWVDDLIDDLENTLSDYIWNSVTEDSRFWMIDERGKLHIDEVRFAQVLKRHGFRKAYLGDPDKPTLLREENHILDTISTHRMSDYVIEEILDKCSPVVDYYETDEGPKAVTSRQLRSIFFKYREKALNSNISALFRAEEPQVMTDTVDEACLYYQNGVLRVTKADSELIDYSQLPGTIWKSQIMQRVFDHSAPSGKGEFEQFVERVAADDPDRIRSFRSVLGYLAHTYKNKSSSPAIVLVDENSSASLAQGGTGKSLYAQSIKHLRKQRYISGKNIQTDSRFIFMDVEHGDQSLFFDDVRSDFDFESLFNIITDDMQVEAKYQNRFTIPFAESPKIVLATNSYIKGQGSSFRRRQFTLPFSNHYSDTFKPSDEFGHNLFEDWDEKEWQRYDHYMVECVQLYFKEGLIDFSNSHYKLRGFKQATSAEFADWAIKFLETGVEYKAHVLFQGKDKTVNPSNPPYVNPQNSDGSDFPCFAEVSNQLFESNFKTFMEWIRSFSAYRGWKLRERKTNGYPVVRFEK